MKRKYGIVGNGKLARHLGYYFALKGLPTASWSRGASVSDGLGPEAALSACEVLLIMVSDSAIEGCIRELKAYPALANSKVIHFSGSLITTLATGFHPLMTFGTVLYDLSVYERMPFVCDEDGLSFQDIFPGLSNPTFHIARHDKAFYHSLCVLAGNFSVLLWQKLFTDLEARLGIPHTAAVPYLHQVTYNLARDFRSALTGPLARRDVQTLQSDEAALQGDPYQAIYHNVASVFEGNQAGQSLAVAASVSPR